MFCAPSSDLQPRGAPNLCDSRAKAWQAVTAVFISTSVILLVVLVWEHKSHASKVMAAKAEAKSSFRWYTQERRKLENTIIDLENDLGIARNNERTLLTTVRHFTYTPSSSEVEAEAQFVVGDDSDSESQYSGENGTQKEQEVKTREGEEDGNDKKSPFRDSYEIIESQPLVTLETPPPFQASVSEPTSDTSSDDEDPNLTKTYTPEEWAKHELQLQQQQPLACAVGYEVTPAAHKNSSDWEEVNLSYAPPPTRTHGVSSKDCGESLIDLNSATDAAPAGNKNHDDWGNINFSNSPPFSAPACGVSGGPLRESISGS